MARRKTNSNVLRKKDLVEGLRRKLPGVFPSRDTAEIVFERALEVVEEALLSGGVVELTGIGWLQVQEGKPTRRVVPGQGEWKGKTKARLVGSLTASFHRRMAGEEGLVGK